MFVSSAKGKEAKLATFRLRHFSTPESLRSIAPVRLLAFLNPYRDFFSSRGYGLPPSESVPELDLQRLIDIFMSPDESSPRELLDSLFLVDEMSTPEDMDVLIDAAMRAGHELDADEELSPADVAVQIWLLDSAILERKHADRFLCKPKSFEYFNTDQAEIPRSEAPSNAVLRSIEKNFDDWFDKKKRGRNSRVFAYPKGDEVWFLVRHGEPFKREESLHGAKVESVCYRPLKYDVVVYDRLLGELRINAQLMGEKTLYRKQFGLHLFGDEEFFSIPKKYTLEPLREYGVASMACGDIEGIESVVLTEIHFLWGGGFTEIEIRRATDVFAAFEARRRELPTSPRLLKAIMKVKFADCKTPRTISIKPPNIAQYTRDDDAIIVERWLEQRGFVLHKGIDAHGAVEDALAGD